MAIAENQRNDTVEVHTQQGMHVAPIQHSFPQRYQDAYTAEIEDFVNGIRSGKLFNVSKQQCLVGHMIADAAHESVRENKLIRFREEYFGEH